MEGFVQCALTMAQYRSILDLLNRLNDYRRIAKTAGCEELEFNMAAILDMFIKGEEDITTKKKPVKFDEYGRTYTIGRRKTSSARVWIIPAKQPKVSPIPKDEMLEALDLSESSQSEIPPIIPVIPSTVLVNNTPLASYFSLPADREKIIRPLKLAGVLGGYNVFALVRGGGTTGQSGAIAHGIAKGIAAHEPQMADVLRKGESWFISFDIGD
jgi:small subunit ribosomal protein S9